MPGMPPFWIVLLDNIGLSALVAMGLVLLTGVGGLTSFGQAAFCGFGAYTTAVLTTAYGLSPWLTLPLSLMVSGIAAVLLGLVTVRLSGHYLPLGTIAWGIGLFYLFSKLEFLGRNDGISGIPPLSIGSLKMIDPGTIYFAIWIAVLISRAADHEPAGLPHRPRHPRAAARAYRRRSFWRADAARKTSGVHLCGGAGRAFRLALCAFRSAPPIRRRSARRPASNISSSRWSAAPATSGAACSGAGHRRDPEGDPAELSAVYVSAARASSKPSCSASCWWLLLQLAPTGVWPWLMARLPFRPARKRPDTSLTLPARARGAGDACGAAADRECAKTVRRRDRGQRRLVRRPGPRDRRPDRPERRRQEHDLQPDHRRADGDRRHDLRARP